MGLPDQAMASCQPLSRVVETVLVGALATVGRVAPVSRDGILRRRSLHLLCRPIAFPVGLLMARFHRARGRHSSGHT